MAKRLYGGVMANRSVEMSLRCRSARHESCEKKVTDANESDSVHW